MTSALILSMSYFLAASKNPVKLSMTILILTLLMALKIYWELGTAWMPAVMILLFTGGVLVVFMILSTYQANEETSKASKSTVTLSIWIGSILTLSVLEKLNTQWDVKSQTSTFFASISCTVLTTATVVLFFAAFLKMLKTQETCLRTIFWRKKEIL